MKEIKKSLIELAPDSRLHQISNPIIGLTGGIASGKTTVSNYLKNKGFHIINADNLIKKIYNETETFKFVQNNFPQVTKEEKIDFSKLRSILFSSPEKLEKMENFLYPKLSKFFLMELPIKNRELVIYDVPLLFEKGLQNNVDQTLLIYSDTKTQVNRIIKRDNSNEKLAKEIIKTQMSMDKKRQLSDYIINNSNGISLSELYKQIDEWIDFISTQNVS